MSGMVNIYATLIMNGKKTLDEVPANIREEVKAYLIEVGFITE